jgi:sialic acid synthase SpsE
MRKPFIVAEISANHMGSLERALLLIDLAKNAGADAVKFQTYQPQTLAPDPEYVIPSGPWAGSKARDLYCQAQTPRRWHQTLFAYARAVGIEPFSTPFSPDDVDFLEEFDCPRYKIASFELVDHELIRYAASTRKPVILSAGMATYDEIAAAIEAASASCEITLLKCTSGYPAPIREANLMTLFEYIDRFFPEVQMFGISDHTPGINVPIAATALGADMIEKHMTMRRDEGGPDAAFSLEPAEFTQMVAGCRDAADALGERQCGPTESEKTQLAFRGRTLKSRSSAVAAEHGKNVNEIKQ